MLPHLLDYGQIMGHQRYRLVCAGPKGEKIAQLSNLVPHTLKPTHVLYHGLCLQSNEPCSHLNEILVIEHFFNFSNIHVRTCSSP